MRTAKINEIANKGEKESIKSIHFYPRPQEREKTQITNIRKCYQQFYTHKFDNSDKIDQFLQRYKLPNTVKNKQTR